MAGRSYSVQFLIQGALSGQFASAMAAAQNAMRGLSNAARQVNSAMSGSMGALSGYLSRLNNIAASSSRFAQLSNTIKQNESALQSEINKARQLGAEYVKQRQQLQQCKAAMDNMKATQNTLKSSYDAEKASLKGMRDSLKSLKSAYDQVKAAQGAGSAQAQSLKAQMEALKSSITSQQAKVQAAKAAYDQIRSAVRQAAQEFKTLENAAKTSGSSFESAKARINSLKAALQQQKSQLESLKSSLSAAGFSTDHFVSSEMRLRSEIEATTRAIERQQQAAARLTAAQGRVNAASSDMSEAQSAFNTVTSTVESIASPVVNATKNAITFEHAMSRVKALTQSQNIREGKMDLVEANMKLLTEQAQELGATTQFTMTEAAQAMGFLGMAGWKTEQIYGTMPGMLNLAAAAGADLAQTADIVSDNMTAMGVAVKDAPHFMDVYAYALTNSNARLTDFGETMKYAAPVAKAYGSTLDETAAMVMMMANAGIKGSMAGTSLRMGLLRLAGPPKTATKEMQKLGLSLSDAQAGAEEAQAVINALGIDLNGATTASDKMTRVLMQLHEKTKNLSQDEKLAAFKGIFGVNAETGWLALFDQGPEVFMKYVEGLKNADGYSKQVASTMMDDTQGALLFLESAIDAASESIGHAMLPAVRSVAETLNPIITSFAQWAMQNPAIIQGIVGIGAALAGVAVLVTGVALAFATWSFITAQIGMFTAGMAAVRAGMLATEVAGLGMAARMGAAFAILRTSLAATFVSLQAVTWGSLFTGLTAQITAATVAVRGFFASLTIGSVISSVTAGISSLGAAFMVLGRAALAFVFSPIGLTLTLLAAMAYAVYANWERIGPAISQAGSALSSSLSGAVTACGNLISALAPIGGAISSAFANSGAADTLIYTFIAIVNVVAGVAVAIINIFSSTVNTIADMFNGLGGVIKAALDLDFDTMGARAFDLSRKIKKDWSNINFSKMDFGYDIGGNISQQIQMYKDAKNKPAQPAQAPAPAQPATVETPAPAQAPAPVQASQPSTVETPQVDMTGVQNAINAIAQAQASGQPIDMAALQAQMAASQQPTVQPQQPTQPSMDTANVQSQMAALGQAAQVPAQNLQQLGTGTQAASQALQQLPAAITPLTTSFTTLSTGITTLSTGLTAITTGITSLTAGLTALTAGLTSSTSGLTALTSALTAASSALNAFSSALQATLGALSAFTAALMSTVGGLSALASSSSSAASAVASLGSAASSAASAMASAASSIASAAASAASAAASAASAGGGAKANYKGGIYNKGAFLTWFAEKSPEAAIPLDKSARAISLWTQAGQMLGVLPSEGNTGLAIERPAADSTQRGISTLQREKMRKAREVYERIVSSMTQKSEIDFENKTVSNMATTVESVSKVQRSVQAIQAAQFDELGNIIGLNGAAGNVITKYDNDKIKHVKKAAQMKEYLEKQSQIEKATREVTKTAETIQSNSNTKWYEKISEKFSRVKESVKAYIGGSESEPEYEERDGVKVYKPSKNEPHILTERERYQSENPAKIKTQDRIKNSRSYQAIMNAQKNVNKNSTSILNRGELNTKIATDVTGGMFGQIFGTDFGLGQIMTQGKASGINPTEVMTSTFPNGQQAQSPNINPEILNKLPPPMTILPQSENTSGGIFGGLGNIFGNFDLGNILGGFDLGKIFGGFDIGEMFGKLGSFDVGSIFGGMFGNKAEVPAIMTNTSMVERLNAVENSERLESVESTMGTRDYSAAAFQPTFHITVNVSGSGEKVDAKAIGEQIAYTARESFEKEYEKYRHEQERRGYV